jgi:AbrB family looped-hinge helix DNA binding protein
MPLVKIGPKHQITIPKSVFETLQLQVGDFLEIEVREGKGILVPKQVTEKAPIPKLSENEQRVLDSVKKMIKAIRSNPDSFTGLNKKEISVAVKVGLIDREQKWWWTEEWQKGEREAEKEIQQKELSEVAENANDFFRSLDSKTS